MNALLVNDEQMVAESIKRQIDWTSCGIDKVFLAFSGEQAREVFRKEKIDIAILDIEMPGESGIELLRWMRSENLDAECIFLTCYAKFEYAQEAVTLGCQDYVLMPVDPAAFETSLKRVVERVRSHREEMRLQAYGRQWVENTRSDLLEQQGPKSTKESLAEEAADYVMKNLGSETLSVNEVADYIHVTPIYLSRIFKQEKKINLSQFIIREKMMLAKKLLEESDLTANTVALRVGYHSYPYFSTTFKRVFGYSPSQNSDQEQKPGSDDSAKK